MGLTAHLVRPRLMLLPKAAPLFFLFLFFSETLRPGSPAALLWTAPAILGSALMIAWAAESAQFFIAQGFALAILALLQTLPEFAVEAAIAWHRETHYLLASLTGALRLLTGFGWPVIYFTAAVVHRRRTGRPLRGIRLEEHHAIEVTGLAAPLLYFAFVIWKGSLAIYDSAVLLGIYAAYLLILSRMPAEDPESIDELERIPRAIVTAPKRTRVTTILGLFAAGGFFIFYSADPFVESLLGLSALIGATAFGLLQRIAPVASEFPEMLSTFYWARTVKRAPMALMNMASSNINQWTLLPALLPVVLSVSSGAVTPVVFDETQHRELQMTLAQAVIGLMFLINMELAFWEACVLFALWAIPFLYAPAATPVTWIYFLWAAAEAVRMLLGYRKPAAFIEFAHLWRAHMQR